MVILVGQKQQTCPDVACATDGAGYKKFGYYGVAGFFRKKPLSSF